ncbi:hypothetical protein PRIPAC_78080 [Pristionchus pacificus]|uniref:Uncharacterized protein n=1 Tax=Pristionchus pacificus TaxID=54126 RepID=A0A2A6BXP3_PRIPA|nr:hypothetical protein PRIPAC_78080 [Pristionchus pacificus]|eukprot:PDM70772.1 hypothetical protein PRIPAC_44976 [Pristionchus pacificus]
MYHSDSLLNGAAASVFFFIFLYFLARHIKKNVMTQEESVMDVHCVSPTPSLPPSLPPSPPPYSVCAPPPPYQDAINAPRLQ